MTGTRSLLTEREKTHGCFSDVAEVAQAIKSACYSIDSGAGIMLSEVQHEALESIATKMARIVCGDPGFLDHWADIAGYARLVVDHLERQRPDTIDRSLVTGDPEADVEVARKIRDMKRDSERATLGIGERRKDREVTEEDLNDAALAVVRGMIRSGTFSPTRPAEYPPIPDDFIGPLPEKDYD